MPPSKPVKGGGMFLSLSLLLLSLPLLPVSLPLSQVQTRSTVNARSHFNQTFLTAFHLSITGVQSALASQHHPSLFLSVLSCRQPPMGSMDLMGEEGGVRIHSHNSVSRLATPTTGAA